MKALLAALALFEWSGRGEQRLVVDWTVIDAEDAGAAIAERLRRNDRSFSGATSIAGALDFAAALLAGCPFAHDRAVVDVSGDGVDSDGGSVAAARDRLVAAGATVNGVIVFGPQSEPHLREHYETEVVGGPGAFVMIAETFEAFAYALVAKLIREVAAR